MTRQCNHPPALACWILQSVVPVDYRTVLLGDLVEEYFERVEHGSTCASASWWFWGQACRSMPLMMKSSLLAPDWIPNATVAMIVLVAAGAFKVLIEQIVFRFVVVANPTYVMVEPIIFLSAASVAGCVARRIRQDSTLFLALFVLLAIMALISIRVCNIPVPWWYQLGFLTTGPASVLLVPAWLCCANREP